MGWPLWMGEPSQITSTLPRILRVPHAQEADDAGGVKGVVLHLQDEPPIERDAADSREMVVGEGHAQHRRLAFGSPGPLSMRQQVEAGFIYPDDGGAFVGCLFF